jgi:GGDEF domain-containing protein
MSYRFERDFSVGRKEFLSNSCLNFLSLAVLRREATSLKALADERRQSLTRARSEAIRLAEALRQALYDVQPTLVGRPFPIGTLSISVGVAGRLVCEASKTAHESEALLQAADRALYSAKAQGLNKVWAIWTDIKE